MQRLPVIASASEAETVLTTGSLSLSERGHFYSIDMQ
jgi:hypothetical protein